MEAAIGPRSMADARVGQKNNITRPLLSYGCCGSCARLEPLPGTSFMTGSGGVGPFPSWS